MKQAAANAYVVSLHLKKTNFELYLAASQLVRIGKRQKWYTH